MIKNLQTINNYSKAIIINKDMLKDINNPTKFDVKLVDNKIVLTPIFDEAKKYGK